VSSTLNDILRAFQDPATKHAAMVHMPIALAFIAPIFLLVAGLLPGRRRMGAFIAMLAYAALAIITLITIQSGEAAYDSIGDVSSSLGDMAHEHGEMAERIWTWGLIVAVVAGIGLIKKKTLAVTAIWVAIAMGIFTAGWAAVAAHKGGVLVYEYGLGTPNPISGIAGEENTEIDPRMTRFLADVRPVLVDRCIGCHRSGRKEGGLALSSMTEILRGGDRGPVLTPGNSRTSVMLTAIEGIHPELPRMPNSGKPLTQSQIDAIRQWIDDGAVWGE